MTKMGKTSCESRCHFARICTIEDGEEEQVSWKCDHCGKIVMNGNFKSAYARIHLAAEKSNGLCANLCTATDEGADERKKHFRNLISKKENEKKTKIRKRKQQLQRLEEREQDVVAMHTSKKSRKSKQPKMKDFLKVNESEAADHAVAQWAIAHDISPNAMQGPYWKRMNRKLSKTTASYTPMYPAKLWKEMLPVLRKLADKEVERHLSHRTSVGRTLTGDGAKKGVPLIDFLVHVPGKGVKLIEITDCTGHLSEGGVKNSLYVIFALYYYH